MGQLDTLTTSGDDESGPLWRKLDIVAAFAVAVLFAWGVVFGGWSVFAVMALFWFENVVIGLFNVAKMMTSGARAGVIGVIGAIFTSAFFIVHYGLFTAVHGMFVVTLFGGEEFGKGALPTGSFFAPLFAMIDRLLGDRDGALAVIAIVLAHGVAFMRWSLATRQRPTSVSNLMAAPYGRIVVLHVTLIAGAFLVIALHAPVLGALLLIALKLVYDLVCAGGERRRTGKSVADERVRRLLVIGRRKLNDGP